MKSPTSLLSPRGFRSPRFIKTAQQLKREAQIDTFRNWAFKQKNDNYQLLKQWDQKRAAVLSVHCRALHQLKDSLVKRIKNSFEFLSSIRQFLNEQHRQLEAYQMAVPKSPEEKFAENEQAKKIYGKESELLVKAHKAGLGSCKLTGSCLQQLKQLIRDFQSYLFLSQSKLQSSLQSLTESLIQLNQLNATASQQCSQLATSYHLQKSKDPFKCQCDIYTLQQTFLRGSSRQQEAQSKISEVVISTWQLSKKTELERSEVLRNTLTGFYNLMQRAGRTVVKREIIEQMCRSLEQHFIQQYYSGEEMLEGEVLVGVAEASGVDLCDFTDDTLRKYLLEVNPTRFTCSKLILRQAQVHYKLQSSTKTTQTIILITVDGFIHLTKSLQRRLYPYCKSDFMFKLDRNIKVTQVNDFEVTLTCNGGIGTSIMNLMKRRKSHTDESFSFAIRFNNQEEKLSFCECIAMILS